EGVFSFYLEDVDTVSYDADFFESEYRHFKVKFYINSVLKNVGWLKPENSVREILGPHVLYRVSFTDGLNDLKNIKYTGFQLTGFSTILETIKQALGFVGIDDLDFLIQCNLIEDNLMVDDSTGRENLFNVLRILSDAFYEVEQKENEAGQIFT